MANPITWKNVNAPDSTGALNAFMRGGQQLGDSIRGIGESIKTGAQDQADYETQDFLNDLNAERDPAKRQAMIDASQAFLDPKQVNAAQKDNLLEDRAVTGEARDALRSTEQTKTFEDTLLNSQLARQTEQQALEVSKNNEAQQVLMRPGQLTNQTDQHNLDVAEAAQGVLTAKLDQAKLTGVNKAVGLAEWSSNTHATVAAITDPDERRTTLAAKITEGIGKGADVTALTAMQRKAFDAEPSDITPTVEKAAGVVIEENMPNGSTQQRTVHTVSSYQRLKKSIVDGYATKYPNMKRAVLEERATEDIKASKHGTLFTDAIADENRSPEEKRTIKRRDTTSSNTARLDTMTGKAFVTEYSKNLKTMRGGTEGAYTPEEITAFATQHRPRVIDNMDVSITGTAAFQLDKAENIKSSDLDKLEAEAAKQVRELIPDATDAEISDVLRRAELDAGETVRQKLISARSRVAQEAFVAGEAFKASAAQTLALSKAVDDAELRQAAVIADVTAKGAVAGPIANELIKYFNERHRATGELDTLFGFQYGDADSEEITKSVNKLDKAFDTEGEGTFFSKGERAKRILNLLQAGEIELTGNNEIGVMHKGTLVPVSNLRPSQLFELMATKEEIGTAAFSDTALKGKINLSKNALDNAIARLKSFQSMQSTVGSFGPQVQNAEELVKQRQDEVDTLKKQLKEAQASKNKKK